MNQIAIVFSLTVILFFGTFSSTAMAAVSQHANENSERSPDFIKDRYIVVLEDGFSPQDVAKGHGLSPHFVYKKALNGFAGTIPPPLVEKLKEDSRVKYVEKDQIFHIATQELPNGMNRINLETNTIANVGTNVTNPAVIAIIDTGVDLDHPDLNVDVSNGYDCSSGIFCFKGTGYGDDDHYHGTHVAGTAAALDNGIGVVGVAPGATIVPVKVLRADGSGSASAIIAGIEYVTLNAFYIDVANMSIGGSKYDPINNAVANSITAGVVYTVAAGNEIVDASTRSPASVPSAITVSAMADFDGMSGGLNDQTVTFYKDAARTEIHCVEDTDDSFACYSNFGSVIDIAAPGVKILSTVPPGNCAACSSGYAYLSGTSMAAPHVAGAAALIRSQDFGMTPEQVRLALMDMTVPQNSADGFTENVDGYLEPFLMVGESSPPNPIPIADAGIDQNANEQASITLDGLGSSDPEDETISYSWSQISGPLVTLINPNTVSPSFTTPTVFDLTELIFSLVVNDGVSNSVADFVSVFVSNTINESPTANAGPDQTITDSEGDGELVSLNGSLSSDPNDDITSWKWYESGVEIANGQNANTLLSQGTYTVTLEVIDSDGATDSDSVTITVQESLTTVTINEPASDIIEGRVTVSATAENFSGLLTFWLVGGDSFALGTSDYPYEVGFHTKNYSPGDYSITANDSEGTELASVTVTIPSKGGGDDGGGKGGGPDCNAKPNHPKCAPA